VAILFGYTDGQTDYLEFGPKTGGKVVWQFFIFTISFFFALPSSSEFEISPAERKNFLQIPKTLFTYYLSPPSFSLKVSAVFLFFSQIFHFCSPLWPMMIKINTLSSSTV